MVQESLRSHRPVTFFLPNSADVWIGETTSEVRRRGVAIGRFGATRAIPGLSRPICLVMYDPTIRFLTAHLGNAYLETVAAAQASGQKGVAPTYFKGDF